MSICGRLNGDLLAELRELIVDLMMLSEKKETEILEEGQKAEGKTSKPHAKVVICVRITFLCNASLALWFLHNERARACERFHLFSAAATCLSLAQLQFSFITLTYVMQSQYFYILFHYIIVLLQRIYSLESELVFLHPRFLRTQFHCFSFLYLLTHTFVYLLFFIHLSLSVSFFLFGATVSFVPAVPFMQILMATTESCEL